MAGPMAATAVVADILFCVATVMFGHSFICVTIKTYWLMMVIPAAITTAQAVMEKILFWMYRLAPLQEMKRQVK